VNLAIRDIRQNTVRFALTVTGVALLLTGASGMGGLYRGVVDDALRQLRLMKTDLWVVEGGTSGPFSEPSKLPFEVRDRALGVAGVANARSYFESSAMVRGKNLTVLGVDWPNDRGDWVPLTQGRHLTAGRGEAVVDRSLGYAIGDTVRLGRDDFRVVGIADRFISSMGDGMIAVSLTDARGLQAERPVAEVRDANAKRAHLESASPAAPSMPTTDEGATAKATAVLVDIAPGADGARVAHTIRQWGDVNVVPHEAQESFLLDGRLGRLRAQILTFTVLLFLITALVVTLIVYTLTMEKLHTIAMLKLLGARDRVILGLIVQQALAIGVVGFVVAQVMGAVLFPLFPRTVVLTPGDRATYGAVLLVICIAASALGISRALRVEAQEVLA
jgi:putative ABC transport system permease protein